MIRADNVRRLTAAGWEQALEHGVRRVVDLRFDNEVPGEPDAHPGVEVVLATLREGRDAARAETFDRELLAADDIAPVFAADYIRMLDGSSQRIAAAVAAIAEAEDGHGVVVHCFAGKDRTGIVAALLLSLAGVPDELVAADYAASDPGVEALSARWFATARDQDELRFRRLVCRSPHTTMLEVLAWVHESADGPERYLLDAGVAAGQIEHLRSRLV